MPPKPQPRPTGPNPAAARLASLGPRTAQTGSASARPAFVPKQVVRRSREEREKSKVEEPVPKPERAVRGGETRGRGGSRGRGGRGGRGGRFEATPSQAAGAFGSLEASQHSGRRFMPAVEHKTDTVKYDVATTTSTPETDDGHDMTRMVGGESDVFPVRPVRDVERGKEEDVTGQVRFSAEEFDGDDVRVKRDEEGTLQDVLEQKREQQLARAGSRHAQDEEGKDYTHPTPFIPAAKAAHYVSPEEMIELKRVSRDHRDILTEFGQGAQGEIEKKLFFFQMPNTVPNLTNNNSNNNNDTTTPNTDDKPGQLGTLRVHKSGKITMLLGSVQMEVSQGTLASFLQDVVVVDTVRGQAHLVGQVTRKMVVTPDVEGLLDV